MATIRDIMDIIEVIAPSYLAEAWDSVGLQVGHEGWPVEKMWVALDPTDKVVDDLSHLGANLLITHHPLIYQPLSALDPETPTGRIIETALKNKLGIFCAHTNLDSADGGVNDMLAERLGIATRTVLRTKETKEFKLVVFVPKDYEGKVIDTLFQSGGGRTEKYTHVSFRTEGLGTFRPGTTAKPFMGRTGEVAYASEYRVEMLVTNKDLPHVLKALHRVHPYEEVAYDIYPIGGRKSNEGLGRIGDLEKAVPLETLAEMIKNVLGLHTVKVVGNLKQSVKRVALCSGSGKSLLKDFFASDGDVYVSGDLGYHDGRSAESSGRGLIDIGHFASEHLVVEGLVVRLKEALSDRRHSVHVEPYREEKDCFCYI